jgi:hypothetical protein
MYSAQLNSVVATCTTDLNQGDLKVTHTTVQDAGKDVEDARHDLPSMDSTLSSQDQDGKEEVTKVIPPVDLIRKSNRAKHPLSAKRNDFLWSI